MTEPSHLSIRRVTQLDLPADDWHWPFAEQRRAEIDAYFATLRQTKPELWNGRVLLAREPQFRGETYSARYFHTDFASFIAWRDWDFPDKAVFNSFSMGALRGSDGGFVLGEMAPHTANAGKVYFPAGTPDPSDLNDGHVDLAASVAREVAEEVGFAPTDYDAAPGWDVIAQTARIAFIRRLDVPLPADAIRARALAHLARQSEPELSAIHVAHECSDITPAMLNYIVAYLEAQFAASDAARPAPFPGDRVS